MSDAQNIFDYTTQVNRFYTLFKANFDHYVNMRDFIYDSSISQEERAKLAEKDGAAIEVNSLEHGLIELVNDFVKYSPTISLQFVEDIQEPKLEQQRKLLESHIRYKIEQAFSQGHLPKGLEQSLSGGFSYLKIEFDYDSDKSFNEEPIIKSVEDPRLIAFDLTDISDFKSEGSFWSEITPISGKNFKLIYKDQLDGGDIPSTTGTIIPSLWTYTDYYGDDKLYFPCKYYKKIKSNDNLVKLADGSVMLESSYRTIRNAVKGTSYEKHVPIVVRKRPTIRSEIVRTTFIGNKILEEKNMKIKEFPFIFIAGNSKYLFGTKYRRLESGSVYSPLVTRSYLKSSAGPQMLRNMAVQRVADDVSDIRGADLLIFNEATRNEDFKGIKNLRRSQTVYVDAFYKDTVGGMTAIPPPMYLTRPSVSSQLQTGNAIATEALNEVGANFKTGIQTNLPDGTSGDAIRELLLNQRNNAAPYIDNMLKVINRLSTLILTYALSIYTNDSVIGGIDDSGVSKLTAINTDGSSSLTVDEGMFKLTVKSDMNAAVARSVNLRKLSFVFKDMPILAQFFNEQKGSYVLSLLDLDDSYELKKSFEQWQQEKAAAAAKNRTPSMEEVAAQETQNRFAIDKEKLAIHKQEVAIKAYKEKSQAEVARVETQLKALQQQLEARAQEQHNMRAEVDTLIALIHAGKAEKSS